MTSTLPPLVQAFSGAVGSASANALTYPLDLVVTRLQLDSPQRSKQRGGIYGARLILRHILSKHGWKALYDGLWPDTCATLLSNFFYFYFYSFLRSLSTKRLLPLGGSNKVSTSKPHKPSMLEELILGFIAGVASRIISTPLNIITLRLQTEREDEEPNPESDSPNSKSEEETLKLGITDVVNLIYAEQGLAGFWRGFKTTTLLSLNPSITLAFLQMFRRLLSLLKSTSLSFLLASARSNQSLAKTLKHTPVNPNQNLHPWEAFFGAAISNSVAVFLLYPLILAKTRLQVSNSKEKTMTEVLVDAYDGKDASSTRKGKEKGGERDREVGITGLYQGLEMKIIKGFLSQGVTFLVKGRIEQLIVAAYLSRIHRQ